MCTVTLSYDDNNVIAKQKLEALINSGLFALLSDFGSPDDEVMKGAYERVMQKECYTPDEAYGLTMREIRQIYEHKYTI